VESGFPVPGEASGDTQKTFADSLIPGFPREISLSMQWVINFLVKSAIVDTVKDLEDLRMPYGNRLGAGQGMNLGSME
jgi:hypothetical protein